MSAKGSEPTVVFDGRFYWLRRYDLADDRCCFCTGPIPPTGVPPNMLMCVDDHGERWLARFCETCWPQVARYLRAVP